MKTQTPATSQVVAKEKCLTFVRSLACAYQSFFCYSEKHIRQMGLTAPQFDIVATLGNTSGMTMSQLAKKTLLTKGAITGIVDRLEKKGLVERRVPPENRRCFIVTLTPAGQEVFEEVFPAHIRHLKQCLAQIDEDELDRLTVSLNRLESVSKTICTVIVDT